jgi:hypothetical protein
MVVITPSVQARSAGLSSEMLIIPAGGEHTTVKMLPVRTLKRSLHILWGIAIT